MGFGGVGDKTLIKIAGARLFPPRGMFRMIKVSEDGLAFVTPQATMAQIRRGTVKPDAYPIDALFSGSVPEFYIRAIKESKIGTIIDMQRHEFSEQARHLARDEMAVE